MNPTSQKKVATSKGPPRNATHSGWKRRRQRRHSRVGDTFFGPSHPRLHAPRGGAADDGEATAGRDESSDDVSGRDDLGSRDGRMNGLVFFDPVTELLPPPVLMMMIMMFIVIVTTF